MAKPTAKKKGAKRPEAAPPDALAHALQLLNRGDYPAARRLLDEKARDPALPDSQRETAVEVKRATRIDPAAIWVGLACIGLFALVILITMLKQP